MEVGRERRGVSTVVAELMMIAVVVALGTVVYTFASTAFGNFGSGFANLVSGSGQQLSERLVVEQVAFVSSGTVDVYVRNVGGNVINVTAVYADNLTSGTFVGSVLTKGSGCGTTVLVGSFQILCLKMVWVPSQVYSFAVATSRGNSVVVDSKA